MASNVLIQPRGSSPSYTAHGCEIGREGAELRVDMGKERFLGNEIEVVEGDAKCEGGVVGHPVLLIGRQGKLAFLSFSLKPLLT